MLVAIPLFRTARRNHLDNLMWLSADFLLLAIAIPFSDSGALNSPWIFWPCISFANIALVMFVHTTFYRGRKSPMPAFLALALLGLAGGIYGILIGSTQLSLMFVSGSAIVIWGWQTIEAYRAYRAIARISSTARWIKSRYLLMMVYGIPDIISGIFGIADHANANRAIENAHNTLVEKQSVLTFSAR